MVVCDPCSAHAFLCSAVLGGPVFATSAFQPWLSWKWKCHKHMMQLKGWWGWSPKMGVKVYTHSLKFKVSDTWLHAKVNIMKKQLSIIYTQVSPEHVAIWYLQDLRIIQVMLRAIFSCTIIFFSLGCPAMASNLIKYEHSFHHSHNRWISIYIIYHKL